MFKIRRGYPLFILIYGFTFQYTEYFSKNWVKYGTRVTSVGVPLPEVTKVKGFPSTGFIHDNSLPTPENMGTTAGSAFSVQVGSPLVPKR